MQQVHVLLCFPTGRSIAERPGEKLTKCVEYKLQYMHRLEDDISYLVWKSLFDAIVMDTHFCRDGIHKEEMIEMKWLR